MQAPYNEFHDWRLIFLIPKNMQAPQIQLDLYPNPLAPVICGTNSITAC